MANAEVNHKDKYICVYLGEWEFNYTALKIINILFVIQFLKTCLFKCFIPTYWEWTLCLELRAKAFVRLSEFEILP